MTVDVPTVCAALFIATTLLLLMLMRGHDRGPDER